LQGFQKSCQDFRAGLPQGGQRMLRKVAFR
jgi:hypothetical protein